MRETSIKLIAPKLGERMASAAEPQLRQIAAAVSRAAVERNGISDPLIDQALKFLETYPFHAGELAAEVQRFADATDTAYLDLSEECEEGRATDAQVLVAFSKARAAFAVAAALAGDALVAASNSTYEAAHSVDEKQEILAIAEGILSSKVERTPPKPNSQALGKLLSRRRRLNWIMLLCAVFAFCWIPAAFVLIHQDAALRENTLRIFWLLWPLLIIPLGGLFLGWICRLSLDRQITRLANVIKSGTN